MDNTRERIIWIDTAKGILMLLVILGHVINEQLRTEYTLLKFVYDFIYRFHMPTFMMLSGMTFGLSLENKRKKDSFRKELLIKDVKTLLVPYFTYGTVVFLAFRLLEKIPVIEHLLVETSYSSISFKGFIVGLFTAFNKYCIHIWYIYVLFFFHLFVCLVDKRGNRKNIILFAGICLLAFKFVVGTDALRIINYLCCYLIFFAFGYIGCEILICQSKAKVYLVVGLFSVFVYTVHLVCGVTFQFKLMRVIDSFIPTLFQCGLAVGVIGLSMIVSKEGCVLNSIGRKSFYIYLFHQPFTTVCSVVLIKVIKPHDILKAICVVLFCFGISLLVSILGDRFWRKIKLCLQKGVIR